MWPPGPSSSISPRFAAPFQTLRTIDEPSYCTQVFEPVSGFTRRERRIVQSPNSKSKSWRPSREVARGGPGVVGDRARRCKQRAEEDGTHRNPHVGRLANGTS